MIDPPTRWARMYPGEKGTLQMKRLKKGLLAATLTSAMMTGAVAPATQAADVSTTIDINFPTVMVLYYYNQLDLDVDAASLVDQLGGSSAACNSAGTGENCLAATDQTYSLDLGSATVTADIETDGGAVTTTPVDVTITDAYGMRCIGCTNYDVAVSDGANSTAVAISPVSTTVTANGLQMVTQDLGFSLDLDQLTSSEVDNGVATESALITVTAN
jgi:hypothetical protein